MPASSATEIIRAIEEAFAESSASAVLVSGRTNPRRFSVTASGASFPIWIYVWTLTHGGGAKRPRDEYRIQLTSVSPPLLENPNGPTLLLGYEPNTKCFAGFDIRKHRSFSKRSPSIQVSLSVLRDAVRDGFAFSRKGNDEIAVAFRPDNILVYSLNSDALHTSGADASAYAVLTKAGRFERVTDEDLARIPAARRRVVSQLSRLVRDSAFRRKVVVAYDRKCCVTGLQLRLVDAAHILPVGAERSTDDVQNGLCLSPTYHRAYDRGLIYLSDDYRMVINPKKRRELVTLGQAGGLAEFEASLGRSIFLPADRNQWPKRTYIRAANAFRRKQGLM